MKLQKIKSFFSAVNIHRGNQCRAQLLKGVRLVNDASVVTLGPNGRNVAIDYEAGLPRITKDGVTVARNVMSSNRMIDIGANILRNASGLTNDTAGDGTTTSILLASQLFEKGQKLIESGINPLILVEGVKRALVEIQEFLEEIKIMANNNKQLILNVAQVSSNYDLGISQLVYDALLHTGRDGLISLETGGRNHQLQIVNGVNFNRGFMNDKFLDSGMNECVLDNPIVYCSKSNIQQIKDIIPYLEYAKKVSQPLLVIAPDISQEVLSTLMYNHIKKLVQSCAITVPGFGDYSEQLIEDIQVSIGCEIRNELRDIGEAIKIKVNSVDTTIIGGKGKAEDIQKRQNKLRQELNDTDNKNKKQLILDRLGRLENKMAIIYIGGGSEAEIHENRDKIIDSLNAAKTSLIEGILPGGGTALIHANDQIKQQGVYLLRDVLKMPLKTLLINLDNQASIIFEEIYKQEDYRIGYDLKKQQLGNMFELGVIDSFNVVKNSLNNGINLGCMLLTCELALIQKIQYKATPLKYYPKEIF